MFAQPQKEHSWLEKLLGDWECETQCKMGPDQPPSTTKSTESVRSLGGMWVMGEGRMQMLDGSPGYTIITLGFDPAKGCFVGTFIGSMMANLWIYSGSLDAAEKVLTLDAEGPDFTGKRIAKYQDAIEIVSDDHRILTSQILTEDGAWNRFMTAHYRRKN